MRNPCASVIRAFLYCCIASRYASMEHLPGHMQVLGSHKAPTVFVDEYTVENAPDPEEFFSAHVKPCKAAIFRGAILQSDAYQLWTDDYVRKNFGDMEVRLESTLEEDFLPPIGENYLGRDTLRHFIDHYHDSGSMTYIVSDLPQVMYHDMGVIPSLGACGEMTKHFVEIDIWWSGGGSKSKLHKDAFNQINCLLNGTKYWKLVEGKYEKYIYKHPEPEYEFGGFSDIDPEAIDLVKYPDVAKIEWSNFTINAGDCLYLPKGYYHQVDSYGTHNLAVSILFGRFDGKDTLNFSDCQNATGNRSLRRLDEFDVHWAWKGHGTMVMGRADLEEVVRTKLLEAIRDLEGQGEHFTFEKMKEKFSADGYDFYMTLGDPFEGFDAIDLDDDGIVAEDEAKRLNHDHLRAFADSIELYEPSANYNFEYSIISYGNVREQLEFLLRVHEELDRDTWITAYKGLGGTEAFGDEIFSRLSGSSGVIVSKDVKKSDLAYALKNWKRFWVPQYSDEPGPPVDDVERGEDLVFERAWESSNALQGDEEGHFDSDTETKDEL